MSLVDIQGLQYGITVATMFILGILIAALCEQIHSPAHYIVSLQVMLDNSCILFKWKLLVFYEQLNSQKKISFSVGSLKSITNLAGLEVC